jgi:hypothetical protein
MAQDKNSQGRSQLASLMRGGATGNASPYDYEKSMFAQRPQAAAGGGGRGGASVPVPIPRPDIDASTTGSVTPGMIANATSPSSLIQSPPLQTSPMPYGGPMAAADAAPMTAQPPPAPVIPPGPYPSWPTPPVGIPRPTAASRPHPWSWLFPQASAAPDATAAPVVRLPYSSRGFGGQ